jgi:hypothetical protein
MLRRLPLMIGVLALASGCHSEIPVSPLPAFVPSTAKSGGGPPANQANLVWHESLGSSPTAIRGDGLNRDALATPPLNEYEGGRCGVWTRIYNGKRDGDGLLKFDPDAYYDTDGCGPRRSLSMDLGNGFVVAGPEFRVDGIWAVAPGASVSVSGQFGMQGAGPACILAFDAQYAGATPLLVTRLDDGSGARRWLVTSQGNHQAACVELMPNGRLRDTGSRYPLPFSVLVTEVP